MRTPRMYVLLRSDLAEGHLKAQEGHALIQYALEHPALLKAQGNETLICLSAGPLRRFRSGIQRLEESGKPFSLFREPDLDNQETALACIDTGEIFKGLPLA